MHVPIQQTCTEHLPPGAYNPGGDRQPADRQAKRLLVPGRGREEEKERDRETDRHQVGGANSRGRYSGVSGEAGAPGAEHSGCVALAGVTLWAIAGYQAHWKLSGGADTARPPLDTWGSPTPVYLGSKHKPRTGTQATCGQLQQKLQKTKDKGPVITGSHPSVALGAIQISSSTPHGHHTPQGREMRTASHLVLWRGLLLSVPPAIPTTWPGAPNPPSRGHGAGSPKQPRGSDRHQPHSVT